MLGQSVSAQEKIRQRVVDFFNTLDFSSVVRQYEFFGANLDLINSTEPQVVISGPADCGKTIAALTKLHRTAWDNPDAQIVIVRKVRADVYSSVLETFEKKILPYPSTDDRCPVRAYGGTTPSRYIYPNGSTIWIAGMDKPGKVLSSERDIIYVNQAEELEDRDWQHLGTRATGRAGYIQHAQLIGDCNPGAPSHWIQQRAKSRALNLLEATHKDNPELYDHTANDWTPEGIKRRSMLQNSLSGYLYKRLFLGLWAAPEGAIYEPFDNERHVCKSFDLPRALPRAVGVDPYGAKIAAVWVAWDTKDKVLHVYREYAEPFGVSTPAHAKNIMRLSGGESIFAYIGGGPSENQARVDYTNAGLPLLEPPNIGVWSGIDNILQLLLDHAIIIHDCCTQLISEIAEYRREERKGEFTDTIANKDRYHMLDALRYVVAWLNDPTSFRLVQ